MASDKYNKSLQNIFKIFIKLAEEMEHSLLFPSLLTDMPVEQNLCKDVLIGIEDFKDLFRTLVSLKHEVLQGDSNWYYSNIKELSKHKLVSKSFKVMTLINEASVVAGLVKNIYSNNVDKVPYTLNKDRSIDRIVRVVRNDDIIRVIKEYDNMINELQSLILIPSLLQDLFDKDLNEYIRTTSLNINQDLDLKSIFEVLCDIRDEIFVPQEELLNKNSKSTVHIKDLHSSLKLVVELCVTVMDVYQDALQKSLGSKETVWKTDLHRTLVADEIELFRFSL